MSKLRLYGKDEMARMEANTKGVIRRINDNNAVSQLESEQARFHCLGLIAESEWYPGELRV